MAITPTNFTSQNYNQLANGTNTNLFPYPPKHFNNINITTTNNNLKTNFANNPHENFNKNEVGKNSEMKNYRSNSHTFQLTHSRNPSAIENMNSSFNKEFGKLRENSGGNIDNNVDLFNNNTNNHNVNSTANNKKFLKSEFSLESRNDAKIANNNIIRNDYTNNNSNDLSDSPLTRKDNTKNFNEREINLIKPYTTKLEREVNRNFNNNSNHTNNLTEKDHNQVNLNNKEYLFPYRQEFGKSLNNLTSKKNQEYSNTKDINNNKIDNKNNAGKEEIKILNIQANLNQIGKLTGGIIGSKLEKDGFDRTNFPLKQQKNNKISEDGNNSNDDSLNVNKHILNRITNNKNNNYINLEFINLSRKKSFCKFLLSDFLLSIFIK